MRDKLTCWRSASQSQKDAVGTAQKRPMRSRHLLLDQGSKGFLGYVNMQPKTGRRGNTCAEEGNLSRYASDHTETFMLKQGRVIGRMVAMWKPLRGILEVGIQNSNLSDAERDNLPESVQNLLMLYIEIVVFIPSLPEVILAKGSESIKVIARNIHFVLSSQSAMAAGNSNDPERWRYDEFYRTILRTMKAMPESSVAQLLGWWKETIFCPDDDDGDDESAERNCSLPSMATILQGAASTLLTNRHGLGEYGSFPPDDMFGSACYRWRQAVLDCRSWKLANMGHIHQMACLVKLGSADVGCLVQRSLHLEDGLGWKDLAKQGDLEQSGVFDPSVTVTAVTRFLPSTTTSRIEAGFRAADILPCTHPPLPLHYLHRACAGPPTSNESSALSSEEEEHDENEHEVEEDEGEEALFLPEHGMKTITPANSDTTNTGPVGKVAYPGHFSEPATESTSESTSSSAGHRRGELKIKSSGCLIKLGALNTLTLGILHRDIVLAYIPSVYLPALEGYVPEEMIRALRVFLEFCYITRKEVINDNALDDLQDALKRFIQYRDAFVRHGVRRAQTVPPRQHSMQHYFKMIRAFGAPNGLCSSITDRMDKLAAAQLHFQELGMMNETDEVMLLLQTGSDDEEDEDERRDVVELQSGIKLAKRPSAIRLSLESLTSHVNRPRLLEPMSDYLCNHHSCNVDVVADPGCFTDVLITTYSSVLAYFYAPSDICGGGSRYDTVPLKGTPGSESIATGPNEVTGMWGVKPLSHGHVRLSKIVSMCSILRAAHLLPRFIGPSTLNRDVTYNQTLDKMKQFFEYVTTMHRDCSIRGYTPFTLIQNSRLLTMSVTPTASVTARPPPTSPSPIARLLSVPPWMKLPAFYLLGAISKNVYDPYLRVFAPLVIPLFLKTYRSVDDNTRSKMDEMLSTRHTGAPNGKELFGLAPQIVNERGIRGDQAGPNKTTNAQLRGLVEAGVSQDELGQILSQLRNLSCPPPGQAAPPLPPPPQNQWQAPQFTPPAATAYPPPTTQYQAPYSAPAPAPHSILPSETRTCICSGYRNTEPKMDTMEQEPEEEAKPVVPSTEDLTAIKDAQTDYRKRILAERMETSPVENSIIKLGLNKQ
ncbi:hypothetical protein NP233_g78 [Leucocoprinus birnbaumii]|uniref:Uncharacterized protein n=1 Tax=Leucocoprinus birnbaumii TaxID=56174 RepID=A0AAD5YX04_9AGAR|nr:hypothetical protein NP233_g78 [Leucocoprinus birnbaumii]